MKHVFLSFASLLACACLCAQTAQWTWVSGDSIPDKIDVYGNKRTLDSANKPGSIAPLNTWTDSAGNLYMFGGKTLDLRLGFDTIPVFSNALWKYSTQQNAWAMLTGGNSSLPDNPAGGGSIGTPGNTPEILLYGGAICTDASGKCFMFGGKANYRDFGTKSQLWQFDPLSSQWTFLNGSADDSYANYGTKGVPASTNNPGARQGSATWTDPAGHLYLYGGFCTLRNARYGDVWLYERTLNLWTWVSGRQWAAGAADGPVYGTAGVLADGNTPGAGQASDVEKPDSANTVSISISGEVWKYSFTTNQWAWISGNRAISAPPPLRHYGIKGVPAAANNPGPRTDAISWADPEGNQWIYGGYTVNAAYQNQYFNDLWKHIRKTDEWEWVDGDSSVNKPADFGTKSIPSATNQPGGRSGAVTWRDAQGNIWLFGGNRQKQPAVAVNSIVKLNDLWKLSITGTTLASKLGGFYALKQDGWVVLHWNTIQEQSSKEFIIERSPDGILFKTIGTVAAAVNTSTLTSYAFTDTAPLNGQNFYRLKQVDRDDSYEFSPVEKVFVPLNGFSCTLRQNPVGEELRLAFQTNEAMVVQIEVRDPAGHVLILDNKALVQGTSIFSLPVARLAKGLYMISVKNNKTIITKQFLKM